MSQIKKIGVLESLRGICALVVAVYHFNVGSHFNNSFTNHGYLCVDFFFVLSGFVIALNYQCRMTSVASLFQFQKKRLIRLYPLHIITLFFFVAIEMSKWVAERLWGVVVNNPTFSMNNGLAFLKNLFLFQNVFDSHLTWNYPSWSISAEFYTYFLFGGIALLCKKRHVALLLTAFGVICLSGWWLYINGGIPTMIVRCLYSFFFGVIGFNGYDIIIRKKITLNTYWVLFFLFLSSLFIAFGNFYPMIFGAVIFVTTVVACSLLEKKTWLYSLLNNRFLIYLGTISYGVYMIHVCVWWCAWQIAKFGGMYTFYVDKNGASKAIFFSAAMADCMTLGGLIITVGLAHFSYQYIEKNASDRISGLWRYIRS